MEHTAFASQQQYYPLIVESVIFSLGLAGLMILFFSLKKRLQLKRPSRVMKAIYPHKKHLNKDESEPPCVFSIMNNDLKKDIKNLSSVDMQLFKPPLVESLWNELELFVKEDTSFLLIQSAVTNALQLGLVQHEPDFNLYIVSVMHEKFLKYQENKDADSINLLLESSRLFFEEQGDYQPLVFPDFEFDKWGLEEMQDDFKAIRDLILQAQDQIPEEEQQEVELEEA